MWSLYSERPLTPPPPPHPQVVYTTARSKAVVPILLLFCLALQFTLRSASCLVLPCSLSMCFSVLLAYWSPCLGKRELVFVLIVHLFVSYAHVNLCHFFPSSWCQGIGCDFCLWLFLDFSVYFFCNFGSAVYTIILFSFPHSLKK